ncbi:hypothetical protein H6G00_01795 [Leptolyngbya sp. FACHB-541]|uniref:hypothetical protein n=1 Tax=Leptolyngbya sp. FACHB-541 TaxID=2692810 RepID=UPI0016880D66|nr:hypothetical protein [Leptolyngbya sp. FACHB-541]MBD1995364.1 hypothetical protein [Leptolyngbya sp. FACHB-541]
MSDLELTNSQRFEMKGDILTYQEPSEWTVQELTDDWIDAWAPGKILVYRVLARHADGTGRGRRGLLFSPENQEYSDRFLECDWGKYEVELLTHPDEPEVCYVKRVLARPDVEDLYDLTGRITLITYQDKLIENDQPYTTRTLYFGRSVRLSSFAPKRWFWSIELTLKGSSITRHLSFRGYGEIDWEEPHPHTSFTMALGKIHFDFFRGREILFDDAKSLFPSREKYGLKIQRIL